MTAINIEKLGIPRESRGMPAENWSMRQSHDPTSPTQPAHARHSYITERALPIVSANSLDSVLTDPLLTFHRGQTRTQVLIVDELLIEGFKEYLQQPEKLLLPISRRG